MKFTIEGLGSPFTVKQAIKHSGGEVTRNNQIKGQRFLNNLVDKGQLAKAKNGTESLYSTLPVPEVIVLNEDGEPIPVEDVTAEGVDVSGSADVTEDDNSGGESRAEPVFTIEEELANCNGSENFYSYKLMRTGPQIAVYTDGVKLLAEKAKAYWLIDVIMSYQTAEFKQANPFQVWILKPNGKKCKNPDGCSVTCEDGNGGKLKTQGIGYTDFPFEQFKEPVKLWFANDTLYLPSEH